MKRILAVLIFTASLAGIASADDQRIRLRGTITALDRDTVSLSTAAGPTTFLLGPTTKISYLVKTDLSAIKPGSVIGTAAVAAPDGTLRAREIQVFLPGEAPRTMGTTPYDLEPNSTMTNAAVSTIADAKVDNVSAHVITVTLADGDKKVVVGPTTPIVTYAPADRSALTNGAHVIVLGVKHDDGSTTITTVQVGQNGLVPPM
jgi:hypothetical protein